MRNPTRNILLWFCFWLVISLFFSSRAYFGQNGMDGPVISYPIVLREALIQWLTWGVFSLLIISVARRIGRGRSLLQRVLLHLPLSFLITSAYFVVARVVGAFVAGMLISGQMGDPMLNYDSLRSLLGGAFQWNYLIYWLIAGGWTAYDYNRESQDRLLRAAQFELRTTQLEQRLTESRLLNLSAQLQPHFLFNALNTISAFVEKDPRGARRMIEHLGDLLRFSLDHSERQEASLEEELAALDHYLEIQRARFEDHLQLRMDVASDTLRAAVPSLILQPLVENAIRHGVARRTAPVRVTICAARENGDLRLRVSDDGPGLPAGWTLDAHAGVGLTNTRRRLEQLYPAAHRFDVNNSDGGGVTASILLPFHADGAEPEEIAHGEGPSDRRR